MNNTPPKNPRISIVMVDGSFRESFHAIDFFGKQTLPSEDYELIWVEFFDELDSCLEQKIRQFSNMRILKLGRQGVYHSSYCFNAGVKASAGELIVIPDADLVVEEDFLEEVLQDHQNDDKLVMYTYRFDEPEDDHLPCPEIEHLREVSVLTNPVNYGACVSVRKKWLLEINGYEQHPLFATGYHANGRNLYARLNNLGLHVRWHPELRVYHPWHPFTLSMEGHDNYATQGVVTDYEARNLITAPFNGLDSERDSEMPQDLAAKVCHMRKRMAKKRRQRLRRMAKRRGKHFIRKIFSA